MPLTLDILHQVVNVHWGGTLPAEFEGHGNVLWKGSTINMSKGTISMWFRVPRASVEDMEWAPDYANNPLQNMVPLLIFSGQPYGEWTEMFHPIINTFYHNVTPSPGIPKDYQPFPYYGSVPGPTWQLPYWPCTLALYIDQEKKAKLTAVLQTRDVGVPQHTRDALVAADGVVGESGEEAGLLFGPTVNYFQDASYADAKMEWFEPNLDGPEVSYDEWHHVLLSWDIGVINASHGETVNPNLPHESPPFNQFITAKSIMYCALDDENLTKNKLPCSYWTEGFGDNEIVCYSCWRFAGTIVDNPPMDPDLSPPYRGNPSYTVGFASGIQMDAVAVPAEPLYRRWSGNETEPQTSATEPVEAIKKIEVAELQIFAGLLLDTGSTSNRRAFIANKKPVDPRETETVLGHRPDILVHTTQNWLAGKNTGKIGLARVPGGDDQVIAQGQFQTTEIIRAYAPDPVLK